MANTSGSSTRNSFEEEESSTFDFSDQEDHSSSSSDAEYEQQLTKDSPVMPQTPVKRPPSSPEIVITKAVRAPEPEMIDGRRPRMRLDLSSLPPAMASSSLASPRPMLASRFSSDDGLNLVATGHGITPGTESALSAFGIAPARSTPAAAYPTPPLRPRRRFTDAFTPDLDSSSPPRRRPSPSPSSPFAASAMQRTRSSEASPISASPMQRVHSADATIPRSPLLDFGHARALYHSILPGDHRFLRSGETPGVAQPVAAGGYFAFS